MGSKSKYKVLQIEQQNVYESIFLVCRTCRLCVTPPPPPPPTHTHTHTCRALSTIIRSNRSFTWSSVITGTSVISLKLTFQTHEASELFRGTMTMLILVRHESLYTISHFEMYNSIKRLWLWLFILTLTLQRCLNILEDNTAAIWHI